LDDHLRQGLREALEALGYFESGQVRDMVLAQPLGNLRREDLQALAAEFGESQLETWSDRKLTELPAADQEAVLAHLQEHDWFLDRNQLDQLEAQPLRTLEASTQRELLEILRRQEAERLRGQRLADLKKGQRRTTREVLQQQGLLLRDSEMRPFRRQRPSDLDPNVYQDLLRDLGEPISAKWSNTRFQNLDQDDQALLSAYLGRRIMARIERRVLLHTISRLWIDYLTDIEDLRRGIGLEAYGQRDPLVEYQRRAFELFEELGDNIRRTVVRSLFRQPPEPVGAQ
jgi:hypothetical protein